MKDKNDEKKRKRWRRERSVLKKRGRERRKEG